MASDRRAADLSREFFGETADPTHFVDDLPIAEPGRDVGSIADGRSPRPRRGYTSPARSRMAEIDDRTRTVLTEIDDIIRQIRGATLAAPAPGGSGAVDPAPVASPTTWDEALPAGAPTVPSSPYLEERLDLAARSLESLRKSLGSLGEQWQQLEGAADTLQRELTNAAHEITYLRTAADASPPPATVTTSPPTPRPAPPRARAAPVPSANPSPPFVEYTAHRYNATVDALKGRRKALLGWTISLAVAISAALVAVQVFANEPLPAIWLAVLPIVWMIPVPFFFLSFFGAQRVLRRNHLDVAEVP